MTAQIVEFPSAAIRQLPPVKKLWWQEWAEWCFDIHLSAAEKRGVQLLTGNQLNFVPSVYATEVRAFAWIFGGMGGGGGWHPPRAVVTVIAIARLRSSHFQSR